MEHVYTVNEFVIKILDKLKYSYDTEITTLIIKKDIVAYFKLLTLNPNNKIISFALSLEGNERYRVSRRDSSGIFIIERYDSSPFYYNVKTDSLTLRGTPVSKYNITYCDNVVLDICKSLHNEQPQL